MGKFVLVIVNGELIGAIKTTGGEEITFDSRTSMLESVSTPSFLSFKNITNEKGELLYIIGGVYHMNQMHYPDVLKEINQQGPYTQHSGTVLDNYYENFQVGILHLKRWSATPATIVTNTTSLYNRNLFSAMGIAIPKDAMYNEKLKTDVLFDLHRKVAAKIDFIRKALEEELRHDPELYRLRAVLKQTAQGRD